LSNLGGVSFGPKPRDFSFKLPLKIRWLAFRSALSAKYDAGQLSIIDAESLKLPTHKTAQLANLLQGFARPEKSDRPRKLLIMGTLPSSAPELVNLQLAAQSLDGAQIEYIQVETDLSKRHKLKQHQIHPVTAYHLIRSHHVCITPEAISFYKTINDKVYQQ
jgi:ribosomal protein L4